jgi:hypothetical protein
MRAEESPGADGDCTSIDGTFDVYDRASLFHAERPLSDTKWFESLSPNAQANEEIDAAVEIFS